MPSSVSTVTASLKPTVTVTGTSALQAPPGAATSTAVTTAGASKPSGASSPPALRIVPPPRLSPFDSTRAFTAPASAAATG